MCTTVAVTCECSAKSESAGDVAHPAPPAASATHSAYTALAVPSTPPGKRITVDKLLSSVPPYTAPSADAAPTQLPCDSGTHRTTSPASSGWSP